MSITLIAEKENGFLQIVQFFSNDGDANLRAIKEEIIQNWQIKNSHYQAIGNESRINSK